MLSIDKKANTLALENLTLDQEDIEQILTHKKLVGLSLVNCPITDNQIAQLCKLPKLLNINLENTAITDTSLAYLATVPNLQYLFIQKANIGGEGFSHFIDHPKINTIWVDDTLVDDKALQILAKIAKLRLLRIKNTRITFEGLMAISNNTRLEIYSDGFFSEEQMQQFRQAQRNKVKKSLTINPTDIAQCQQLLQEFFSAMTRWEYFAKAEYKDNDDFVKLQTACQSLFDIYCTPKPRYGYRPESIHFSNAPNYTYATHTIIDEEQLAAKKINLFTKDGLGFEYKFAFINQQGQWKIDECYRRHGNWMKCGL